MKLGRHYCHATATLLPKIQQTKIAGMKSSLYKAEKVHAVLLLLQVQRFLALCHFWDWEKVTLAKNRIRQIDRINDMNST